MVLDKYKARIVARGFTQTKGWTMVRQCQPQLDRQTREP